MRRPRTCILAAVLALALLGCQSRASIPITPEMAGMVPARQAGPSPTVTALPQPSPSATAAATTLPVALPSRVSIATAQPTAAAPASTSPPTIRLLFTGDINPGRCPAQVALARDDFTRPYHVVGETLRAADLTIGSLDGTLSDISAPSPCPESMNLIGPSRTVEGLQYAGFDVITTATNHAKDCGTHGYGCDNATLFDTLRHLEEAGIAAVGTGDSLSSARAPAILERHGVRFAFLGVTAVGPETWATEDSPGTAPLSDEALYNVLAAITSARSQADVVIVLAQWGTEYTETPTAEQLRWAEAMVDAGATLVVGNHPHVVQPVEVFPLPEAPAGAPPRGVVAYALGNFVFDQGPWRTRQGVVFEAVFHGSALADWRLLPIHIHGLHQPRWADEAGAQVILERVAAGSTALPPRDE